MVTHLEKLWCALYISSTWYETWERYKESSPFMKRFALKCKTVGIIEYDRTLNQYENAMMAGEGIEKIFIFGEK